MSSEPGSETLELPIRKRVFLKTKSSSKIGHNDADPDDEATRSIKLRINLNRDRRTGTISLVRDTAVRKPRTRLNIHEESESLKIRELNQRRRREVQALNRRTRYVKRHLQKNAKQTITAGLSVDPASISLFDASATVQYEKVLNNPTSPVQKRKRTRKQSEPIHNSESFLASETIKVDSLPLLNEWPDDFIQERDLSGIMEMDVNVEQLLNVDENLLRANELNEFEVEVSSTNLMKALQGDDDEIEVLCVLPTSKSHKFAFSEEKPALNQTEQVTCKKWNKSKNCWESTTVDLITRLSYTLVKVGSWDWEDEWESATNICNASEFRDDDWQEFIDAEPEFSQSYDQLEDNNDSNNNNNRHYDFSVSSNTDTSSQVSPLDNSDIGSPPLEPEEAISSLIHGNSHNLVDLGYMDDLF